MQGTALMPGAGMLHMASECAESQAAVHGASLALVSTTLVAPLRLDDGELSGCCMFLPVGCPSAPGLSKDQTQAR